MKKLNPFVLAFLVSACATSGSSPSGGSASGGALEHSDVSPQMRAILEKQWATEEERWTAEEEKNKAAEAAALEKQKAAVGDARGKAVEKFHYDHTNGLDIEPGVLTVVDSNGAEARRVLRATGKPGKKKTGNVRVVLHMGDGKQLGAVQVFRVETLVQEHTADDPDEAAIYEATVVDAGAELGDASGIAGKGAAQATELIGMRSVGNKMRVAVSPMGIAKGSAIDKVSSYSAEGRRLQRSTGVGYLTSTHATALPDEAVGVGAKWTAKIVLKAGTVQTHGAAHYELVSLNGDKATIKWTLELKLDKKQDIQYKPNGCIPGQPENSNWANGPGVKCTQRLMLVKNVIVQDGEMTLDLGDSPVPDSYTAIAKSDVGIEDLDNPSKNINSQGDMKTTWQADAL